MSTTMKLYETTAALQIVDEWIDEHRDEIARLDGEMPPELLAALEQAEGDFAAKAERVALKIRELTLTAEAYQAEVDRLRAHASAREKAADALKRYLLAQLQAAGRDVVQCPRATLRVQLAAPSLRLVADEATVLAAPEWQPFVVETITHKIDRKRALAAMKDGVLQTALADMHRTAFVRIY